MYCTGTFFIALFQVLHSLIKTFITTLQTGQLQLPHISPYTAEFATKRKQSLVDVEFKKINQSMKWAEMKNALMALKSITDMINESFGALLACFFLD